MGQLSPQEHALFLRFVWGRTRLPRNRREFEDKQFVLQVRGGVG